MLTLAQIQFNQTYALIAYYSSPQNSHVFCFIL